jgi:hypothetical protein
MILYSFEYDSYGESYHVMAQNKLDAINYVLEYLYKQVKEQGPTAGLRSDGSRYETYEEEDFRKWREATNKNDLPEGYELKEYKEGEIINTELS